MKSKSFILMILSLGFGLVAAIGISQVMKNNSANASAVQQMGTVIVATDHLDIKTELTKDNVRVENWPLKIIPEDAVRSMEEIKDRAVTMRMPKGMPIVKSQIANKNEIGITSIPPGFKVLSIKVSGEGTLSGLLSPGDKVDIIGLFKRKNRKTGAEQTISKTFLKAIRVFAINGNMNAVMDRDENTSSANAIVSVLVTQTQAEEIAFAQKVGDVKLTMRGETEPDDDEVESLADIMRLEDEGYDATADDNSPGSYPAYGDANPAAPSYSQQSMVVWSGTEARKYSFANGFPQEVGLESGDAQYITAPARPQPATADETPVLEEPADDDAQ